MIRQIFHDDIRHLFSRFFAIVIAVGVCFISPLYAWANIYSNWDPYGSTGNMKLAAISLDRGYTDEDGEYHNSGDEIIRNLHENDAIDWQFVDSEEDAVNGVKDGTYYGAIVVTEDFTYDMYNVFRKKVNKPQIKFYQNQKKNPVANKITETVADTVRSNIDSEFVKVMTKTVFEGANDVSDDLQSDGGIDGLLDKMQQVDSEIRSYESTIDVALQGNASLTSALNAADASVSEMAGSTSDAADSINSAADTLGQTRVTLQQYTDQVNASLNTVENALNAMINTINAAAVSNDVRQMQSAAQSSLEQTKVIRNNLTALKDAAGQQAVDAETDPVRKIAMQDALNTITVMESSMQAAEDTLETMTAPARNTIQDEVDTTVDALEEAERAAATDALKRALTEIENTQNQFNNSLKPQMDTVLGNLTTAMADAGNLMRSMSDTLAGMGGVFSALETTINSGSMSLTQTRQALELMANRLEDAIDQVQKASDDEKVQVLMNTLSGNPESYADFFAEPVTIDSQVIYPVENYGSAVTPFYTALAIWVGGLLLAAILKPHPDSTKYPGAKNYQLFFGRFMVFALLSQVSTLITVIGDLSLLHVQCLHPFMFWLACAITGFTFTLLIYSLVYAFGNVGKAIAVVIVVLQIAGSSGTYPIELLPAFFRNVYRFFPFPYAINAMRECIGGLYGNSYAIYLMELGVFILVGLAIGIWMQKPFAGLLHFMEKRMHDTQMM